MPKLLYIDAVLPETTGTTAPSASRLHHLSKSASRALAGFQHTTILHAHALELK